MIVVTAAKPLNGGCLDELSVMSHGASTAVAVDGTQMAFQNGTYLQVASIADPTNPVLLGELDLGVEFWGTAYIGGFVYVPTADHHVTVVDVSDPTSPAVTTSFDLGAQAYHFAADGDVAYVSASDGLHVLDVTSPQAPQLLGLCSSPTAMYWAAPAGALVYEAATDGGLSVIDVSDPAAPFEVARVQSSVGFGYAESVAVQSGYAFVADLFDALLVYDISDPQNPAEVALLPFPGGSPESILLAGSYAVLGAHDGLHVVDVSQPTSPTEVGALALPAAWYSVAVGNEAVVAADDRVAVVSLDQPSAPVELGSLDVAGPTSAVALGGSRLVTIGPSSLTLYDLSNPTAPAQISRISLSRPFTEAVYDMEISGDVVYVAEHTAGLALFDVSDPVNPIELPFVPIPDMMRIDQSNGWVFAAGTSSLTVVDATDPASAAIVANLTSAPGRDVQVVDDLLLVASNQDGLHVVDISAPASPVHLAQLDTEARVLSVGGVPGTAYAGGSSFPPYQPMLLVIDLSDPANPSLVSEREVPQEPYALLPEQGRLLMRGIADVTLYDLNAPRTPVELAYLSALGSGWLQPGFDGAQVAIPRNRTGCVVLDATGGDAIFADDFESGTTGEWSAAVP